LWPFHDKTHNLFVQLNVPNNPIKDWFIEFGWEMTNYMCEEVLKKIQIVMAKASFLSLNVNEIINVND
jgi:hypothetical protein